MFYGFYGYLNISSLLIKMLFVKKRYLKCYLLKNVFIIKKH